MIYTSYFAQLKNIPNNIVPISICGKAPYFYKGLQYKKLAPSYDIFIQYKQNYDAECYTKRFWNEILSPLNVNNIVKELYDLAQSKDIVLLCYEKPSDFCHRHLVAQWLNLNGYTCLEWKKGEENYNVRS